MGQGSSVVSVGGGLDDTMDMLALHERAVAAGHSMIVGAACSPGASGLLLHYMLDMFDTVDEVHLAVHGTGGPQCARAHHDGLAGVAVGWHDGEWFKRPGAVVENCVGFLIQSMPVIVIVSKRPSLS